MDREDQVAKSNKIKIMLSSRCDNTFPKKGGRKLSDIRVELKNEIEASEILGQKLFEVWINEDAPPSDATQDSWEVCLGEARDCDILIVITDGDAGWAKSGSHIGICHAEYKEGLDASRGKVHLVALPSIKPGKGEKGARDRRFQEYLSTQTPFRGGDVHTVEDLKERVFETVSSSMVTLTQRGVSAFTSSRYDRGQALDWSRLDFRQRKQAMEAVLLSTLEAQAGKQAAHGGIVVPLGGSDIAVVVHAIPAAFSVAAARELVGRPFLQDHERVHLLAKAQGPLHLIACHRGATEAQATSLLGFPDATVVSGSFGVFVADEVQKVQFVFLANCRDETQTRHTFQRFQEWLVQTGEGERLARRGASRAKIIKTVAGEM